MTSPCIGVCRLVSGQCVGCYRTLNEIARWSRMGDEERAEVLSLCEERKKSPRLVRPG